MDGKRVDLSLQGLRVRGELVTGCLFTWYVIFVAGSWYTKRMEYENIEPQRQRAQGLDEHQHIITISIVPIFLDEPKANSGFLLSAKAESPVRQHNSTPNNIRWYV